MAKGRQPPKAPPKKTEASDRYDARAREIKQQAARRASHITTALAAGLGGLAIYEVGRHTYQNIQRKQAAAQRSRVVWSCTCAWKSRPRPWVVESS